MTATKKKNDLITAQENVDEVRRRLREAEADLVQLHQEREEITRAVADGSILADTERLDELEESLIPRKTRRRDYLRDVALPITEAQYASLELTALAADLGTGIPVRYTAFEERRAAAEEKVLEAVADLRTVADEWNGALAPLTSKALRAGLDNVTGDPLSRVLAVRDLDGKPTGVLEVDGTEYRTVNTSRAIGDILRKADPEVKRYVDAGREADWLDRPWR